MEGKAAFQIPGISEPCYTWYKTFGDVKPASSTIRPLILVHGGPGACHEYLLPFLDLYERFKIPLVFYDQIGGGRSTRLPQKSGDQAFWIGDLFLLELQNLIRHLHLEEYDVYGHSWGGMLLSKFASQKPAGLRHLILAGATASAGLLAKGMLVHVENMPPDISETIRKCDADRDWANEEYKDACMQFYKKHLCRLEVFPDGLVTALEHMEKDSTVYADMAGPSELLVIGSLKDWDTTREAADIEAQTLIISGRYDQIHDLAVQPFFDQIPNVEWVKFGASSHVVHYEERERCMQVVSGFLSGAS